MGFPIKQLKRLKPYLAKYKNTLLLGCSFVVLANLFALLSPWLLKIAIDEMSKEISSEIILKYSALIVGAALAGGVFRFLMRNTIIGVSRHIEYDLRNDFFRHIQTLPQSFYNEYKTGDLMARATNDLEAVRQVVGPAIMYSFNTIVSMAAFGIMLFINPKLTFLSMIPFPLMAIVVHQSARKLHDAYEKIQAQYAAITSKVQENLSGIRVVKAYVQEDSEIALFDKLNQTYIDKNMSMAKIRGVMTAAMTSLVGVGSLIVLWAGGHLVMDGRISLGDFVAFFAYLSMLTWPMIALGWVINLVQQGTASMGRLNRIFDSEPDIKDGAQTKTKISSVAGSIEFRNLSFAYGGAAPVIKDINLKIDKGMTLAIVGRTGSGKTTLINLVPRLLQATTGSVLIDGRDIREFSVEVLRRNIGYVPQDTFLFSDTISNNIDFGVNEATENEINEAAEIAQIKKDIFGFPNGFDTLLGERGINISGGQKQRTAIARAIIRKPKILILDDCLSAVDTHTEEAILKGLRGVMRSRTSIIVSHRVSTVKDADLIIVLEGGQIKESGTHDELISISGIYAELYQKQLLEEAVESFE